MRRAILTATAAATLLTACAPSLRSHGYAPQPEVLDTVEVGIDTRQTVASKLGRPGDSGILENDEWYYVATTTRTYLYNAPEVIERRVVAVQFDEQSVVRDVTEYTLADGRDVEFVSRTTETFGSELSVVQQLLGNIFNPAGLLGDGGSP
ncbi:outer membrane protein assembly factor BamE [Pontivivens ytuae]|uniref:Outer membrane protein assembly factor BamE n=1 Tax=Pontivivens ytuae TaxID=2789856 RepID=A0A7S9LR14_9RHOB|nr:outer membrane protein assembly factor BamE [Pontivivens ytuae]QPH53160.1 outer membrane protein assembly factor BamE [Pontivivens ytuae]